MHIYLFCLFSWAFLGETDDPPIIDAINASQQTDSIPAKDSVKTARWFIEGKEVPQKEGVDLYYDYKTACWIFDNPKEAVFKFGEKARDGIAICVWNENSER